MMGLLVDGVWRDDSFDTARMKDGRFNRPTTKFRNWVTPDGSPGPSGEGGFPAEPGRYHLYVSLACPWAHRTIIFRQLKQLESAISMSVTSWHMGEQGWTFDTDRGLERRRGQRRGSSCRRSICSPIRNTPAASACRCCGTRSASTIVNNESSEIIRMLNSAFDAFTNEHTDYYPAELRGEIDASTSWSTRTSTTASIAPASPPRRRPTRRRSATCSRRSTSSSGGWRGSATSPARA